MSYLRTGRINGVSVSSLIKTSGVDLITCPIEVRAPLYIDKLVTNDGYIGKVNLQYLINNRISLSEHGYISGSKSFESIEIGLHLKLSGKINGLNPSLDLMFRSKPQLIKGLKVFNKNLITNGSLVLNQAEIHHQINWMKTYDLFNYRVHLHTNEYLPMYAVIYNCTIPSIRLVAGQNFNHYNLQLALSQLLYQNSDQRITGEKRFINTVTVNGPVTGSATVNGISMRWLKANVIKLNGTQIIPSPMTFLNSFKIMGSLTVNKLINYKSLHKLAYDSLRRSNLTQLRGPQVFLGGFTTLNNLSVRLVNNIDLRNDILRKTESQSISGHIKIKSLTLSNDVQLFGYLNGLNLINLDKSLARKDRPLYLRSNLILSQPSEVYGNLQVKGTVNQINLTSLVNDILVPYGQQFVSGIKSIREARFMGNINVGMLNGKSFNSLIQEMVFIDSPWPQMIKIKTFDDIVQIKSGLYHEHGVAGGHALINGVNISHLYTSAVPLDSSAVVRGNIFFANPVISESIYPIFIKSKVNGINLVRDVFWLNPVRGYTPQIWAPKVFGSVYFGEDVIIHGRANHLNISHIASNTLYKRGQQYVAGPKSLQGRLIINKNVLVESVNHNRVEDILTKTEPNMYVYGNWTFANNANFDRSLRSINGLISNVNLTKIVKGSLFKDSPRVLTYPITFERVEFNRDVQINGTLNQMSMNSLKRSVQGSHDNFTQINNEIDQVLKRNLMRSNELLMFMAHPAITIEGFNFYQNLNDVTGNIVEYYEKPNVLGLADLNHKNYSAVVYVIKYDGLWFKVAQVNYRPVFWEHKPFNLDKDHYAVYQTSSYLDYPSLVKNERNIVVQNLGSYLDDIQILTLSQTTVILASLSRLKGLLIISAIQKAGDKVSVVNVTSIHVGPGAVKTTLFEIDKEVYFIVARSYHNVCGGADSGTLIYHWSRKTKNSIEIIQRISSIEPSDVEHYELNGQHYLVFIDSRSPLEKLHHSSIYIYRNSINSYSCQFSLFQTLNFDNLKKVAIFKYKPVNRPLLFLAAVNSTMVRVWKQDGKLTN